MLTHEGSAHSQCLLLDTELEWSIYEDTELEWSIYEDSAVKDADRLRGLD